MALKNSGKFVKDPLKFGTGDRTEETNQLKINRLQADTLIDRKYGFERLEEIGEKIGFLINMRTSSIVNAEGALISAMDYYFIEEDGTRFKISLPFQPYFLVLPDRDKIEGVGTYLTKRFTGYIKSVEKIVKEDLDLLNHLVGLKQTYLKLNFETTSDLLKVRKDLQRIVKVNQEREKHDTYYISMLTSSLAGSNINNTISTSDQMNTGGSNLDAPGSHSIGEYLDYIRDIREHDVAYSVRVSIDTGVCVGRWYQVKCQGSILPPVITHRKDLIEWPEPIVFAFDIETTKLPLRFPDANSDQIMMISYMIDGQGFLITNREIVSSDVENFEYSPRPDLEGHFSIWNAANEQALLERFFAHILEVRPHVFVTYNGDFFDWPFVEARAKHYGMDMTQEIGFSKGTDGVYSCRTASHMDCICWVKRDSYLPMGSHGLKAVAKAKLRYDPVELDPEDMCPMAVNNPQVLANYSVSDAVATYYLYMKYVHPFIFALCTIIPRDPDEVLRKGSGTLCESLLMVEAFHANVVFPNRQEEQLGKLTKDGRLLDAETYVGGHVEALESGVFRSDLPCRFRLVAKKQVAQAIASGDIAEIKSARNREVLYDSLQLAHKCILNSFYGYVMRKGARWYSMEMAGIVCHTGANIIRQAREIIEQVGRPLELDTDGIWCVLPASFPENFEITTTNPKKAKVVISYPNAVLNQMVKENYTNHQYQELIDPDKLKYEKRSENSIFFEVDGPYRAMVLPASKEEGKKLKKRYAVFNDDGSLAELKGFEVKRRGELKLIKVFQSSVFEAFLKGNTLEECYANVAKVADYWLDASSLSDTELMDLISENRSMSKKLEEYGTQKSTSISTAKRLAEFLGDQMVKDAGLSCRFIVSRQPEGSPVTERAVPVAIFQAEESVRRHYLCRWLKDSTLESLDIRSILDWNYYIERLGGCIQKIVTIPAAMQGVNNPVPRCSHPDWLHRRLNEKGDARKQRRIDVMFQKRPARSLSGQTDEDIIEPEVVDIEDASSGRSIAVVQANKRKRPLDQGESNNISDWRSALGPPPPRDDLEAWLEYHKRKWTLQAVHRKQQRRNAAPAVNRVVTSTQPQATNATARGPRGSLGNFLRRAQQTLLNSSWQVVQLARTNEPGVFRVWALVGSELHQVRLVVPRVFYVNQHEPMSEARQAEEGILWRAVNRTLPRGRPMLHLYRYSVPEKQFLAHTNNLLGSLATPDIEGIYETQVSLEFRALLQLGCMCGVTKGYQEISSEANSFSLDQLQAKGLEAGHQPYLSSGTLHALCLCILRAPVPSPRALLALILPPSKRAIFIAVDSVRTNQMPNIQALYTAERNSRINNGDNIDLLPPAELSVEVRVETDLRIAFRILQRALQTFRDEKKGPSYIALQSNLNTTEVMVLMPGLFEFPVVPIECQGFGEGETRATIKTEALEILSRLEWQRLGSRAILNRYIDMPMALGLRIRQCRYLHVPLGNLPPDPSDATLFATDLMFARHLLRQNFLLWCSSTDTPDLGGREADDYTLVADAEQGCSVTVNNPGCYSNVCVELLVDALAVDALIQSDRINTMEGTSSSVAFDRAQPLSVSTLAGASQAVGPILSSTPCETAICSGAFRVMKAMVGAWLRDVGLHENVFADLQIAFFYRWLCSPQTLLYDPALRQGLQLLMKKLFLQLVAEFRRMGAVIVYANLSRIILSTRKYTIPDAINYLEFVVASVKNKELFHSIGLKFEQCWQHLLWLGPTNYAGVKGNVPSDIAGEQTSLLTKKTPKKKPNQDNDEDNEESDVESDNDDSEDEEEEEEEPEIEMEWSLAMSLPNEAGCRENFNALVAGYLSATFLRIKEAQEFKIGETPVRKRTMSQPTPLGSVQQSAVDFAKSLIMGELGQKLFQIVDRLNRKLPGNLSKQRSFSQSLTRQSANLNDTGSNEVLSLNRPALEFTKAICKVLELDDTVKEEVGALRRNMLRLISVSEFSDEAEWQEPCLSVTLPEVLCHSCNYCHELDLVRSCRWDNLEDPNDGSPAWTCPLCHIGYEKDDIEYLVLESFNRRTMAYNLQDLQCSRCQQVKMENMLLRCNCAAPFRTMVDSKQMNQFVQTLASIADCFSMPVLAETMHWAQTVGFQTRH